jgi:uncharacterized phosphosugar-binding protein
MTEFGERFSSTVSKLLKAIDGEYESINRAAALMCQTIADDKLIHVIGTGGHSNIGTYELFMRAGSLVPVNGILDPGTLVSMGALRSTRIERTPGYAAAVLDSFDVHDGVLLIINAYGINSLTIDTALEGRKRGIPTIGVTSPEFGDRVAPNHPARHPSGQNLYQIVDVFVNCHMPYGDAVIQFEGMPQKVAPVSTVVLAYTLNLIVIETVRLMLEKGIEPPVWVSANLPGGDEMNRKHIQKYKGRIRLM